MSLAEFSVRKRVTVIMMVMGLLMLGVISFLRLPQELFPPIVFPQVTIVTDYANAAPEEVETLLTKPIEESIGSVSGLKRIESISREGRSTVIVSFDWGQDIDFAALAIREKIDLIKERLPKEAEDPVVLKFDPLARPIMILSVTSKTLDPIRMKHLSEKMLKDNLEKMEGVASVSISGGVDREILVEIDQGKLRSHHLSILEVIESIENANVTYPAGSIKKGLYEYLIRTVGEFRNVQEIGYVVAGVDAMLDLKREDTSFVEQAAQGPRDTLDGLRYEVAHDPTEKRLVLVRDIADVVDGTGERTSVSRYNGANNISLQIQKQANANTIELVDQLRRAISFLDEDIRSRGLEYDIIYDHSVFIRESLKNLLNEAISGGFLAFLVLLFFLRNPGPSLLVTLSIPITVVGVFFLMSIGGITINIMSLGGLALGVGMIVDTSIVVLENIFRCRQLGDNAVDGAIKGTDEVVWPVIASNITTIAVFFPLIVFVPGIPGQLFKDLSWTVIYSQILSTFIPLTLVAMLSVYLKVSQTEYRPLPWTDFFENRLKKARNAWAGNFFLLRIIIFAFGLCSITFIILPRLDREVLPKVDQGQFIIKVNLPIGTRLEITDHVCQAIEQILKETEIIKDVAVTIGAEKGKKGEVKIETLRASQALILVTLDEEREVSSASVVNDLQEEIAKIDLEGGRVDFVLQESEFAFAEGGSKPILIELKGFDLEEMGKLVTEIKSKLATIPGVLNIQDDRGEPVPETKLEIDKRRAALYGISALDISLIAKAAIDGVVATQYREAGREFDIRVRLREKDRHDLENLNSLLLYSQVIDALLPLKEVAVIDRGFGPSEIRRVNQERTIIVSADINDKTRQSKDVLNDVQSMLRTLEVPPDFQVDLSGKAREVAENFQKLVFALILSLFLIYMIMASQFESFLQPFLIMLTVPLGFFGVSVALWVSGTSINVISLLGVIIFGGVGVNNGIVLIEYINQLREQGKELEESAWEASKVRTRPILMSALTTIFGLLPLALGFGEGAELRRPMAVALMGGMLSATFLTLIVIPSLYILVTRFTERFFEDEDEVNAEEDEEEKDEDQDSQQ